MVQFVDLSHELRDGMAAYPGLPSPRIRPLLTHEQSRERYAGKAEFLLGHVEMPGNAGTYLDSPFHRYPQAQDLSQLPLSKVAGLQGVVVDGMVAEDRSVAAKLTADQARGRAILIRTGWDRRWGTEEYWHLGPYIGSALLDLLASAPAALVGVDFWNVDDTKDLARPVHTRLLGTGIPIVEHLRSLDLLPPTGWRFYAAPLPIVGGASFPVRAFAELDEASV